MARTEAEQARDARALAAERAKAASDTERRLAARVARETRRT